eukprot:g4699.t1
MSQRCWRLEGPPDVVQLGFDVSWTDSFGRRNPDKPIRFNVTVDSYACSRVVFCGLHASDGNFKSEDVADVYSSSGFLPGVYPSAKNMGKHNSDGMLLWEHALLLNFLAYQSQLYDDDGPLSLITGPKQRRALTREQALFELAQLAVDPAECATLQKNISSKNRSNLQITLYDRLKGRLPRTAAETLRLWAFIGQATEALPSSVSTEISSALPQFKNIGRLGENLPSQFWQLFGESCSKYDASDEVIAAWQKDVNNARLVHRGLASVLECNLAMCNPNFQFISALPSLIGWDVVNDVVTVDSPEEPDASLKDTDINGYEEQMQRRKDWYTSASRAFSSALSQCLSSNFDSASVVNRTTILVGFVMNAPRIKHLLPLVKHIFQDENDNSEEKYSNDKDLNEEVNETFCATFAQTLIRKLKTYSWTNEFEIFRDDVNVLIYFGKCAPKHFNNEMLCAAFSDSFANAGYAPAKTNQKAVPYTAFVAMLLRQYIVANDTGVLIDHSQEDFYSDELMTCVVRWARCVADLNSAENVHENQTGIPFEKTINSEQKTASFLKPACFPERCRYWSQHLLDWSRHSNIKTNVDEADISLFTAFAPVIDADLEDFAKRVSLNLDGNPCVLSCIDELEMMKEGKVLHELVEAGAYELASEEIESFPPGVIIQALIPSRLCSLESPLRLRSTAKLLRRLQCFNPSEKSKLANFLEEASGAIPRLVRWGLNFSSQCAKAKRIQGGKDGELIFVSVNRVVEALQCEWTKILKRQSTPKSLSLSGEFIEKNNEATLAWEHAILAEESRKEDRIEMNFFRKDACKQYSLGKENQTALKEKISSTIRSESVYISQLFHKLERILGNCASLLPSCWTLLGNLTKMHGQWPKTPVYQIFRFMGVENNNHTLNFSEEDNAEVEELNYILPSILVNGSRWIELNRDCRLFRSHIANLMHKEIEPVVFESKGANRNEPPQVVWEKALVDTARFWHMLHDGLDSGTIKFSAVYEIIKANPAESELEEELAIMHRTCRSALDAKKKKAAETGQSLVDLLKNSASQEFEKQTDWWAVTEKETTGMVSPAAVEKSIQAWVDSRADECKKFRDLEAVCGDLEIILSFLQNLAMFLSPKGQDAVNQLFAHLNTFRATYNQRSRWGEQTLAYVRQHLEALQCIDKRVVDMDPDFVKAMCDSQKLLFFLRDSLSDDEEFQNALDVAMGTSEMECPEDLWEQLETNLSSLQNVRTTLHSFIYREEDFADDLSSLLDLLGELPVQRGADNASLLENMRLCARKCVSFSELLCADSDEVAPNRLLSMLEVSHKSTWCVDSSRSVGGCADDCVWLTYTLTRQGRSVQKEQTLSKLLDFESSLVLAKTTDIETRDAIDRFIYQFRWVREVNAAMWGLREAGHFQYMAYKKRWPMVGSAGDPAKMHFDLVRARLELKSWTSWVAECRSEHYSLNSFSVRQIEQIVSLLQGSKMTDTKYLRFHRFRRILACLGENISDVLSDDAVEDLWNRALQKKKEFQKLVRDREDSVASAPAMPSSTTLKLSQNQSVSSSGDASVIALGVSPANFDNTVDDNGRDAFVMLKVAAYMMDLIVDLFDPKPRIRKLEGEYDHYPGGGGISSGVNIVVCNDSSLVTSNVLSIFAREGILPERPQLLLCGEHTNWEMVQNLLLRWATHHKHRKAQNAHLHVQEEKHSVGESKGGDGENKYADGETKRSSFIKKKNQRQVYCLAAVNNLNYELQRKAAEVIEIAVAKARGEGDYNAMESLVIVSGEHEKQHIVAQFVDNIIKYKPLPIEVLRQMSTELSKRFSLGASVFTSRDCGMGKSFSLRSEAQKRDLSIIHVPLYVQLTPEEVLGRIHNALIPLLISRKVASLSVSNKKKTFVMQQYHENSKGVFKEIENMCALGFSVEDSVILWIKNILTDDIPFKALGQSEKLAVYIEIGPTCKGDLDPVVFEFVFLGGLINNSDGAQYIWDPKKTAIFIELASTQPPLSEIMSAVNLMEQRECVISQSSFCASRLPLRLGRQRWGIESASINDTIKSKQGNGFSMGSMMSSLLSAVDAVMFSKTVENASKAVPFRGFNSGQYVVLHSLKSIELFPREVLSKLHQRAIFRAIIECAENRKSTTSPSNKNLPLSIVKKAAAFACNGLTGLVHNESSGGRYIIGLEPDLIFKKAKTYGLAGVKNIMIDVSLKNLVPLALMPKQFGLTWKLPIQSTDKKGQKKKKTSTSWTCHRCTFKNGPERKTCAICATPKRSDAQQSVVLTLSTTRTATNLGRKARNDAAVQVASNAIASSQKKNTTQKNKSGTDKKRPVLRRVNSDGEISVRDGWYGADAYTRLQTVCAALGHLQNRTSTFPVHFSPGSSPDMDAAQCLMLLLKESQQDKASPSLHSIWSFVDVLYDSLRDLHHPNSIVQKYCEWGRGLAIQTCEPTHYKRDVVRFLVRTAREFSAKIKLSEDSSNQFENLIRWNDSDHMSLLFQISGERSSSQSGGGMSFLSLKPDSMRAEIKRAMPVLWGELSFHRFNVGEDLDTLSTKHAAVLSTITGVFRTHENCMKLLDGRYCMTGDALLKMVSIFTRVKCGVPVLIMGECGCGKTELIRYLCAFLNVKLFILNVHGGTTASDILNIFEQACQDAASNKNGSDVWVFLDEVNTCSHMGLMQEALVNRSLYGQRLPQRVKVLGACNPYRLRPKNNAAEAGLSFKLHTASSSNPELHDEMKGLVYRVHPVPRTLLQFVFDYGALSSSTEKLYIESMVKRTLPTYEDLDCLRDLLHVSQAYVRSEEKLPSATSLRDVKRCLNLLQWFERAAEGLLHVKKKKKKKKRKRRKSKKKVKSDRAQEESKEEKEEMKEETKNESKEEEKESKESKLESKEEKEESKDGESKESKLESKEEKEESKDGESKEERAGKEKPRREPGEEEDEYTSEEEESDMEDEGFERVIEGPVDLLLEEAKKAQKRDDSIQTLVGRNNAAAQALETEAMLPSRLRTLFGGGLQIWKKLGLNKGGSHNDYHAACDKFGNYTCRLCDAKNQPIPAPFNPEAMPATTEEADFAEDVDENNQDDSGPKQRRALTKEQAVNDSLSEETAALEEAPNDGENKVAEDAETIVVTCPAGVTSGQQVRVPMPNGGPLVVVEIPEGVVSGGQFRVAIPKAVAQLEAEKKKRREKKRYGQNYSFMAGQLVEIYNIREEGMLKLNGVIGFVRKSSNEEVARTLRAQGMEAVEAYGVTVAVSRSKLRPAAVAMCGRCGGKSPVYVPSEMSDAYHKPLELTPIERLRNHILALAHVYYYRLPTDESRQRYWKKLEQVFRSHNLPITAESMNNVILEEQMKFCAHMILGDGIAPNYALRENLFVMIVCIYNRIPIFVVGKPGSSKSLAVSIISSNLRGVSR